MFCSEIEIFSLEFISVSRLNKTFYIVIITKRFKLKLLYPILF